MTWFPTYILLCEGAWGWMLVGTYSKGGLCYNIDLPMDTKIPQSGNWRSAKDGKNYRWWKLAGEEK